MYMALLDAGLCSRYKGIYRKVPTQPKGRQTFVEWLDYMELTEGGFPIEYSEENYIKLLSLYTKLLKQNVAVDFIVTEKIPDSDVNVALLGFDVTNDTMFYSILGEVGIESKPFINKQQLNDNLLFNSRVDASNLAKYMNENALLFECDGEYKCVPIYRVSV